jgi:UDPglucose--hexose-1-phosphate uridylyltransferase
MNGNEMRLDPLRQTWTVFCPARAMKPRPGSRMPRGPLRKVSPFAPGNEHLTPNSLLTTSDPEGRWRVRVFPNRVPVFGVEGDTAWYPEGFYDRTDGVGAHEIVVESPDDRPLEKLPLPSITDVLSAWRTRMGDLTRDGRLRAFHVVKTVGALAGAQYAHAISQVIAAALVPVALKQKLGVARDFYQRKKRSIFEEILREEVRAGKRLVYENTGFAVFCPYASRSPFEMAIYPKRQLPDFHRASDEEMAQLADGLRSALLKLAGALDAPSYTLTLFTAPGRTGRRDHWQTIESDFRWHIEIVPRVFAVDGFEQATGWHINPVLPETAADYLRSLEV